MKKFSTLLATVFLASASFAQVQRLVLCEEYTQASCGPCASQNPGFNTLLAANTNKVVSVKYQTSWPGVDPMNAQNPTDAANRVSYYTITGVPHGKTDGVSIVNDCSAYTGAPMCLNQAEIDAAYNVPSPFTLNLSHVMSTDFDSAYVTVVITAAQAFTSSGTFSLRLAMVEKEINFLTPPGSNGEVDFYMVMRKMYPNGSGTTLGTTWTNAQTQTLNFAVSVPTYIYDLNEIAFVAFLQSNTSRVVHQAAYSAPILLQNDAGVTGATGIPSLNCTGNFTPSVTITNGYGATTLTSCDINYQIDANPAQILPWTGSLAMSQSATVALPALSATDGSHTLTIWTSNPNGSMDQYPSNNQQVYNFVISLTPVASPIQEGFVGALYPPNEWAVGNANNNFTWTRWINAGGFGNSTTCTKMDFYSSPASQVDELYLPFVDLSASNTAASLTFNMAYSQQYTASADRLEVRASGDCGATWTTVFNKFGAAMSTTSGPQVGVFNPLSSQWRNEIVDLSAFAGQNDVSIKFVATSNSGNNLYVDDINLTSTTSVAEIGNAASIDVYPNPFSSMTSLFVNLSSSANVKIEMYNVVGEKVKAISTGQLTAGEHSFSLDGSSLSEGVYFVTLQVDHQTITKKVLINR